MIIDPYSRIPQAALFKSSKIFKLYEEDNCQDVMETCLLFPIDDNLNLIAQYPLGLYHSALIEDEQEKKISKSKPDEIGGLVIGTCYQFYSKNFPKSAFRHRFSEVWLDPEEDNKLYRDDSTWRVV